MQTKKLVWATAALAASGLVLTACGSGGGGTKTQKKSTFNAALTAIVNPSSKKGGELKAQASSDFDSLDPARTYYAYSWDFQRLWQRTLLAFKPAPGLEGNKLEPDIATSLGKASADAKTWTYTLKKGIKFEDGTAVTSKDVKYAVERIFAGSIITGGPTYLDDLLSGQTPEYKGPYTDKTPDHMGLTTVDTPNDQTIVFHLNKPFSDFDYLMSIPGSTPVPSKVDLNPATGGTKYAFRPVSVGPYKIASYTPNKSLKLVRNDQWDPSTDSLRKALPDTVNVTMGLDPIVMDNNLFAGTYDLTIDGFGLQQADVPKASTTPEIKARSDNGPGVAMRYISIQQEVAPLNNVHCRRAVQYAADKVALQYARGGPVAGGKIEGSMVVPSLNSYEKDYIPYPSGADNKGNLDKAKEELAACGKPGGFKVNMATTNKGKGPLVATALQQALKRVNIDVNIEQVDAANYYSGFIGSRTNVKAKKLGLAVAGWGPDFPTEYGYWESIIDGAVLKRDVSSNYAALDDPAINADIKNAIESTDAKKKAKLWIDVSHRVMDSAVLLPFVSDIALGVHSARVTNVSFAPTFGLYDYMNVGVVS